VLNRASQGLVLFTEHTDYLEFYRLLLDAGRRFAVRVCAYCLMPNHWHLVLWPLKDGAVSAYIHWVATRHSLRFRLETDTVGRGHVYQDRFHSFPVQTGRYYFNVVRYVEANALESHVVSRAEDWPWSSLAERLHGHELINDGPLELPEDWADRVNVTLPKPEMEVLTCCERSGRPYGAPGWAARTAIRYSLEQTLRVRGRPRVPDFPKMRLT
jgi:putative transposase